MKDFLPEGHGLSQPVLSGLVFREDGNISLTDVQHKALEQGVACGKSMLVVSPTSTGKTLIGLWAIAEGLSSGNNTVYLVTHRALAKQKFEDFQNVLLEDYLGGDKSAIVIATGDYVEDGNGQYPSAPLSAPLLVATYEKYLVCCFRNNLPMTCNLSS
ncbi:putative helicase HelY [Pseudomonas syringae pv. actinidiae]|uniref:DEAD/DEAH box helicase n=1 Tax=Pseudomonas syringae TaxID=317 RepID=UPI000A25BBBF|nr:DEAD/DEAH box helicase [Pseudomonas syringae]OSR64806.1 putative helicase HelY [Pseudomonas syringae pv. actinidiae]